MKNNLPLRAIEVFDVVARLSSCSRAAEVLDITQGAVSHQIKVLEKSINCKLFERSGRAFSLTETGLKLYKDISPIMEDIEDIYFKYTESSNQDIKVTAFATIGSKWLIPKLVEFNAQHPEIDVTLNLVTAEPKVKISESDIYLTGKSEIKGMQIFDLFQENLLAIYNSSYCDYVDINNIQHHTLLRSIENGFDDWKTWCEHHSVPIERLKFRKFNHVLYSTEAAIAGHGVALVNEKVAHTLINSGNMKLANLAPVVSGFSCRVAVAEHLIDDERVKIFIEWLILKAKY